MHSDLTVDPGRPADLRRMEGLLLVLLVLCLLVWQDRATWAARGVPLMPLWLHTVIELFSGCVSLLLFAVVWNVQPGGRSADLALVGHAGLGVGLLDIAHALSYQGMPAFITPSGPAKAIDFWLWARLWFSLALLAAAVAGVRPLGPRARYWLAGASLAWSGAASWLVLLGPDLGWHTYEPGLGLTGFKIACEWAIVAVLVAAALLLYRRALRSGGLAAGLFGVAVATALSELCFMVYVNVTDVFNLLGHLVKVVVYVLLYRTAFRLAVREPLARLQAEATERAAAEQALRQLNATLEQRVAQRTAQLERANSDLEAFAYTVSHDLRAPLHAIDGFARLLRRGHGAGLDATGLSYLARIEAGSERMGRMIDDLLDLAHLGRGDLRREPVDVSRLAAEVLDELRERDPQRAVRADIAPGIVVQGDPVLLRLVLDNLLGNAWKFSAARPLLQLRVAAQHADGWVTVSVADNGSGFDPAYATRLFEPFQRLHPRDIPGNGIGLASVRRIVTLHGGRAWAEGREGKGATFYLTLPECAHA
ncbi:hypothetical protein E4L96_03705 [Massilia arenosa]|uniref:histidine kinase n=1 Tax=Zemynaea arenosa TaxID=2561931 RepID=A0A4Y9SLE2_9BURK|nr:MASE3 domain-containing protein [Massilia arenosa]TFW27358.1 hypothetical protein E4L96_03705 [Massilia arenosa]